ncbi:MAG: hypothetical protein ACRC7R_01525 [Sarcina sp.]
MEVLIFRDTQYGVITYSVYKLEKDCREFQSKEECLCYISEKTGLSPKELKNKGVKFNTKTCYVSLSEGSEL